MLKFAPESVEGYECKMRSRLCVIPNVMLVVIHLNLSPCSSFSCVQYFLQEMNLTIGKRIVKRVFSEFLFNLFIHQFAVIHV